MVKLIQKKGVSVMIGYILLIVFGIIISVLIYMWMKTYIPDKQPLECSAEISLFIKSATFDSSVLNLTLKNNGKFNVAGYFIHGKNSSGQEIATIDLSDYLSQTSPGEIFGDSVAFFEGGVNSFKPGEQANHIFNVPSYFGDITEISVTPTIFQEKDNKNRFVSCGNSKTEGIVGEPFVCTDNCATFNYECGTRVICGVTTNCGNCGTNGTFVCNGTGTCVLSGLCTDTCLSLGLECNTWEICGINTYCGTCSGSDLCNATGQCNTCEPDPDVCLNRACGSWTNGTCGTVSCGTCPAGQTCNIFEGTSDCYVTGDCNNACYNAGYVGGTCVSSSQGCGGVYPFQANQYCGLGTKCCCTIPVAP